MTDDGGTLGRDCCIEVWIPGKPLLVLDEFTPDPFDAEELEEYRSNPEAFYSALRIYWENGTITEGIGWEGDNE